MQTERLIQVMENSFISSLLKDSSVTDISFNGENIFYVHNEHGRLKSNINISDTEVKDFVRQIANLAEKQFSYQIPFLDVSFGKYRFNAVHDSIARISDRHTITFSLRIASSTPRINDDSSFLTPELVKLFSVLLDSQISMIVAGVTGCGKTEFQKYLLRKIKNNQRIVIIDNVLELDSVRQNQEADLTFWQFDERNQTISIQALVKNALRSNPDWLIVAESRAEEMLEVLNSAMTGHPIITTIHALDAFSIPHRLTRMIMMSDKRSDYNDILADIFYHIRVYIFLKKTILDDGSVYRYIDSITFANADGQISYLYKKEKEQHQYFHFSEEMKKLLKFESSDDLFIRTFIGD